MKKIQRLTTALLAAVLAVSLAAAPALAEDSAAPTPTPVLTEAPDYDSAQNPNNSGRAYVVAQTVTDAAGGEITSIERDDTFNLVLRVVDYEAYNNYITADKISARINSAVFTFTGNAEVGQLYEETDQNGAAYYSYVLLFRDVIYNGGGSTVPINLSYLNSTVPMQQLSTELGQCVDQDPTTPSLMIRESSYGNEAIVAGTPFTLSLTLYATSGEEALNDVMVTLTLPEGITMTSGSLSTYVGTMAAQSTQNVSFSLTPSAGFTGGVANITVNSTATSAETKQAVTGAATTISVPVSQPDRFELGQLQLNDTIYLGESATVSLNFVNKGRNALANLEAVLSGSNLGADTTVQYIGTLNAGSENSVDFDMTPTEAGNVSGTITLTYEDANGETKSVEKAFSFTVEDMPSYDNDVIDDSTISEPEQAGFPVWAIVLVAAAAVAAAVIIVTAVRKKKKAAVLAELEGGDDEDL